MMHVVNLHFLYGTLIFALQILLTHEVDEYSHQIPSLAWPGITGISHICKL